ncbi:NAD-dependent epimerase/dehydratase family protein [candidate division WOR-3 bacterium]|nr:NAD-dependent epimerase/dehydratase family protein [candidate division WOR-3 bacterium]
MLKQLKDKEVLVTGGLGFIGSNIAHKLLEYGAKVTIIDSLIDGLGGNLFNVKNIEKDVKIVIADLRDDIICELVHGKDYIFNLAGQVSHIDSMEDPFTDLAINCQSQLSLLEACKKYNPETKIMFAGTRQVYGKPRYLPVNENHSLSPTDVNGINKIAGEWYHILYNKVYGIRTVSLRLTNTYGPKMLMKHSRQGFIAWFIRQVIDNEEIKIFGDGKQIRDFNYVDDVIKAFLLTALNEESNGKIYNLGGGNPTTLLDFVKLLIEINGNGKYKLVPFPEDRKKIDIGNFYADYTKIKKDLNWQPKILLREGLKMTIEYYRKYKKYYW